MNKNWYIVYSKAQFEKRIVNMCNKKKIENYFPLTQVNSHDSKKGRELYEPLFLSLIFVKIGCEEMNEIKKIEGVLSIMYWKDKPAMVKEEEIAAIKEFTAKYQNIKVQHSRVNMQDVVRNVSTPIKSVDGKVYSISCKTIKMNLPSLGFVLVAEVNTNPVFGQQDFELKNNFLTQY
jgi:transcription antitermination factor NusG